MSLVPHGGERFDLCNRPPRLPGTCAPGFLRWPMIIVVNQEFDLCPAMHATAMKFFFSQNVHLSPKVRSTRSEGDVSLSCYEVDIFQWIWTGSTAPPYERIDSKLVQNSK